MPASKSVRPTKANRESTAKSTRNSSQASTRSSVRSGSSRSRKPAPRDTPERDQAVGPIPDGKPPRLQRVLAAAGLGSRRSCEELIVEGRVDIDGKTVTELGVRCDIAKQKVRVDGEYLRVKRSTYYAVNKPTGIVSTNRDQAGRMRVVDLVPNGDQMFTVGRLDMHSSGLIIVTNDGDLANRLAHPRYEVDKTYRVTVAGYPDADALQQLRKGIHLAEGPVRVASVRIKSRQKQNTILQIVLQEGRNREIRRMAARIGHKVLKLERIAVGTLRLGEMPAGAYRELTADELRSLQHSVAGKGTKRRRPATTRRRTITKVARPGSKPGKPSRGQAGKQPGKRRINSRQR